MGSNPQEVGLQKTTDIVVKIASIVLPKHTTNLLFLNSSNAAHMALVRILYTLEQATLRWF